MRNIRVNSFALGFIVLVALIATVVMTPRNAQSQAPAQPPVASFSCNGFAAVRLTSTLPRDLIALAQQQGADCFAWQSFIALNWPALPSGSPDPKAGPSDFGKPPADPLNPQPTVWQTFYDSVTALTPNASRARSYGHMRLRMTSKVGHRSVLNSIGQAFTNGAWLTDQAGGLVFYEILVNPDEFNYIQKNALYSIPGQNACVKGKGGLILPDGAAAHDTLCTGEPYSYGTTGAIEIKSAWIVLDPKNPAQLNRYLIARALVQPPNGPATTQTVGLVGLHIIRKGQLGAAVRVVDVRARRQRPRSRGRQEHGAAVHVLQSQMQPADRSVPMHAQPDAGAGADRYGDDVAVQRGSSGRAATVDIADGQCHQLVRVANHARQFGVQELPAHRHDLADVQPAGGAGEQRPADRRRAASRHAADDEHDDGNLLPEPRHLRDPQGRLHGLPRRSDDRSLDDDYVRRRQADHHDPEPEKESNVESEAGRAGIRLLVRVRRRDAGTDGKTAPAPITARIVHEVNGYASGFTANGHRGAAAINDRDHLQASKLAADAIAEQLRQLPYCSK